MGGSEPVSGGAGLGLDRVKEGEMHREREGGGDLRVVGGDFRQQYQLQLLRPTGKHEIGAEGGARGKEWRGKEAGGAEDVGGAARENLKSPTVCAGASGSGSGSGSGGGGGGGGVNDGVLRSLHPATFKSPSSGTSKDNVRSPNGGAAVKKPIGGKPKFGGWSSASYSSRSSSSLTVSSPHSKGGGVHRAGVAGEAGRVGGGRGRQLGAGAGSGMVRGGGIRARRGSNSMTVDVGGGNGDDVLAWREVGSGERGGTPSSTGVVKLGAGGDRMLFQHQPHDVISISVTGSSSPMTAVAPKSSAAARWGTKEVRSTDAKGRSSNLRQAAQR